MTIRATWNGEVLAESDRTVMVEGNHYFPPSSVRMQYMQDSPAHTRCPWKGKASYYDIVVDGQTNRAGAWYYPKPWPLARKLRDHVAFWQGVVIEETAARR